jgi:IS5 family transposase
MDQVVPWSLLRLSSRTTRPRAATCRLYPLEAMLRVHLMQSWFALSDPAT